MLLLILFVTIKNLNIMGTKTAGSKAIPVAKCGKRIKKK